MNNRKHGCDLKKRLAIIGHGSQGLAWSQNLSRQGWEIAFYLRAGSASAHKVTTGLALSIDDPKLKEEELVALLIPDEQHPAFLEKYEEKLSPKALVILAHGYSYEAFQFETLYPKRGFALCAPKAIASELSKRAARGAQLAGVWHLNKQAQTFEDTLKTLMHDLGLTYTLNASFEAETKADLFSEQTLLCSLLPYGAAKAFQHLVDRGISRELAFIECWMEMKLIADTLVSMGPLEFFNLISPNALIGGHQASKKLLGAEFDKGLEELYTQINDGSFYKTCRQTNAETVRSEISRDWGQSDLQKTFEELKKLVQD